VRAAGIHVCCGGIVGMGETLDDRAGMIATLASLPAHPDRVPINMLVQIEGTPLAGATNSIRSILCAPSRSHASRCRPRWCDSRPVART
jgi:biotin synthase-like enzyme